MEDLEAILKQGAMVFPVHGITEARLCTCRKKDCGSPGKHPIYPNWQRQACTSLDQFDSVKRAFGPINYGLITGGASQIIVVDVDKRDDHDGAESLKIVESKYSELPRTVESLTGAGRHIFLRIPERVSINNRVGIFQGIDIRGEGGFVVIPPSRHHSGKEYAWDCERHPEDISIAFAPPWLTTLIASRNEKQKSDWQGILKAGFSSGTRNCSLTKIAGHLLGKGVSFEVALVAALGINEKRCFPPLPSSEVFHIVRSIAKRERGKHDGI
ncbi:MAG: bifunctional DNA primase/polymerase [Deltaproteobacteria bacterium]|nr:bifunctional DNA primase/polymerase [Deltaproteobacteria bacterium]